MIYIHGDTHGEYSYFSDRWLPGQSQWTSVDKLIITGDFGFVFRGERNSLAEKNNLDALAKKSYEILFLDGNHEGFDYLEDYPEEIRYGAPVRRIRDNIFWLQRGYIYTIEDHSFFVMGGGYSIDKAWRLGYQRNYNEKIWFAQELPSQEEYRRAITALQNVGMKVDYILTHTAPRTIIPRVIFKAPDPQESELTGFLDWVYHEVDFKKWYIGHLHMDLQVNEQMIACFDQLHIIEEY